MCRGLPAIARAEQACGQQAHEEVFRCVVYALLLSGSLPPGAVVDAGAHTGAESCAFAHWQPNHQLFNVCWPTDAG